MKKFVFILLILTLLFAGCTSAPEEQKPVEEIIQEEPEPEPEPEPVVEEPPIEEVKEEPKEPLPAGYKEKYQMPNTEYDTFELPTPMPATSLNLVGVYDKETVGLQEMDQKVYVFNFPSELEAKFFFDAIFEKYSESDKMALRDDTIGPNKVYFRYDNVNWKYEGSFFIDSKNVYYIRASFSDEGDKEFIRQKFL